jgi:hypothetical protein
MTPNKKTSKNASEINNFLMAGSSERLEKELLLSNAF